MSSYKEGQAHQLSDALEEAGFSPDHLTKMGQDKELLRQFRDVLEGKSEIKPIEYIIDCDADPFLPDGWKVEEHQRGGFFKWTKSLVVLHLDESQKNGKYIGGHDLRKALKSQKVLNANVLDFLLKHPEFIPEEWKGKGKTIVFWGTIFRDSDGDLVVRYLYWNGGRWNWNYNWLDNDWNGHNPAAVRANHFIREYNDFSFSKIGKSVWGGVMSFRKIFVHMICDYNNIIAVENLLSAWKEFSNEKKNKKDVQEFSFRLMENIFHLNRELTNLTYKHGAYQAFNISDPKPRKIHKAQIRDRLLHHAVYRILYPFFDKKFIHDSYSCRDEKGTHRAMNRFRKMAEKCSKNHTKTIWALKCDIKKFFASIDHEILLSILNRYLEDKNIAWLLENIIRSFNSGQAGKGLPLGNLTSQLLANIYLNELDQFAKHKLKLNYYIRFADDFVVISHDRNYLGSILASISEFLETTLKLHLHSGKVFIKTFFSGVDFLGWVHFPKHRALRTATKRKMFRNLMLKKGKEETLQSYLGMLKHGNARKLAQKAKFLYDKP